MKWIIVVSLIISLIGLSKNLMSEGTTTKVAIIVPGLGDNIPATSLIAWWWKRQGIRIIIFETKWKSNESFENKLKRLIVLIDKESINNKVSLVGTSAGGSLVINVYRERPNQINKVITVCSRLKKGENDGFRGFEARTKGYPAFKESVIETEKVIGLLRKEEKQRIMTIRALFGDELVPAKTATISGAKNTAVFSGEHTISIAASLTIFSNPIVRFIKE